MTCSGSSGLRKAEAVPSSSRDYGHVVPFLGRSRVQPLVTKAELAAHLQVHPKTIERRVQDGMPCLRVGRRALRFRVAECEAWLEAQS